MGRKPLVAFPSDLAPRPRITVDGGTGEDDDETETVDAEPTGNLEETYAQAKTRMARASADREEFNRDIARINRDELRGALVTRKEALAAAAEVRDAFVGLGKQLWPKVDVALPEGFPASQRQQMAVALKAAWDALLSDLSL